MVVASHCFEFYLEATVIPPKKGSQHNVVGTDQSLPLGPLLTRMDACFVS